MKRFAKQVCGVMLVASMLSGCSYLLEPDWKRAARQQEEARVKANNEIYTYVSTGVANHTSQFLYEYSIDGSFGGNMTAYSAGGAGTCCVRLRRVYQPGMQVKVDYDLTIGGKHNRQSKIVTVEPYAEAGSVYVHFFPGDEIRVVVSPYVGPGNPEYPIPAPVDPRKSQGERP